MRPMVPYKATAIDAELPTASTCMHQSGQQLRKLATHGRKIPVIPRQRKHRINTIDAEANELADVTYVQLPKEAFHLHLVKSISDRMYCKSSMYVMKAPDVTTVTNDLV